jgi:hypothetical protein
MESQTPLATATDSLAFMQSAKLSRSAIGEASLCFDTSNVLESAELQSAGEPAIGPGEFHD